MAVSQQGCSRRGLEVMKRREYPSQKLTLIHPFLTYSYEDRRTAQLVMPQVYLGPAWSASNLAQLHSMGITHILSLRSRSEANSGWIVARWPSQFKYCELEMQEGVLHQQMPRDASLSLLEVYIQSLPFLSDVLSSGQHRCLVHDDIGISRAPALVTCWVMQLRMQATGGTFGLNFFDASEFVRARRGCISISETWWSQGEVSRTRKSQSTRSSS